MPNQNLKTALDALNFLHPDGGVFEICLISPLVPTSPNWTGKAFGKKPIVAGWFRDQEKAANLATRNEAEGIYTTLNPCQDALIGRADHRLKAGVSRTKDEEIEKIQNLLIDLDPIRPEGISSTDAEHQAALEMAQQLRIPSLDITGRVLEKIVDENPLLLYGNVWGSATLMWKPQKGKEDHFEVVMTAFKPMQAASIDLDYFLAIRKEFTLAEWQVLLTRCMGYAEDKYTPRQKMLLQTRLIPLVEPRVNIMELAPKGTGKSYIFSQLSRHAWLISGGVVTRAQLFYDMSRQQTGIISRYDAIVLDEIQTIRLKDEEEIVGALKGYLESGEFRVMGFHGSADAGFVILGNIPIEDGLPKHINFFQELPGWLKGYGATALLDRFHGLLPGWELPRIESSSLCQSFALRADYFGEVLYSLRSRQDHMAFVKDHTISDGDLRDTRAIQRLACGYLKLLFPDIHSVTTEEFDEFCLQPAVALRSNIRLQMAIMDPEFSPDVAEIMVR